MKPPVLKSLKLKEIEIADLQARARTDDKTVSEYAEAFQSGEKFPAVTVFHDGKAYFLADGFHRYFAAKESGLADILADIRQGTRKDALWFAAGANKTHGLKRSNEDKRHAVELALREKPEMADRSIAQHVGVGPMLVGDVRRLLSENTVEVNPPIRIGVDGKHRKAPPIPVPIVNKLAAPPKKSIPPVPAVKKVQPDSILDKTGCPVPANILPMWERGHEVQADLHVLSELRVKYERLQTEKDLLYIEVNHQRVFAELNQAYADVKTAIPFAVCPTCQGKTPDNCALCKGRGFISEHRWNTVVTKEAKEMRSKVKRS